jgi:alanine racemase
MYIELSAISKFSHMPSQEENSKQEFNKTQARKINKKKQPPPDIKRPKRTE